MEDKKKVKKVGWLVPTSLVLIFVAIIAIIILLLNGETKITGEFEGQKNTEALICEGEETAYPIFKYDNANSKSLKINAVFEDEKLTSISLIYKLDYDTEEEMKKSESVNHVAMSDNFADDGMEFDDLNSKYSFLDNSLQFSLYGRGDELNQKSLRYFMLLNIYDKDKLTKEKAAKTYNEKGLDCEIKHNKSKEEVNEN